MSEKELIEKYNDLHHKKSNNQEKGFIEFLYNHTEVEIPEVDVDAVWEKTREKIQKGNKRNSNFMRVAASIAVLIGISFFLWQVSNYKETIVISSNDQKLEVTFPDGSKGVLNKVSSVSFLEEFGNERIVDFQGEAYFDIQKSEKPFIIKGNGADVRVLGTAFNLISNEQTVELTLEEGLVSLEHSGKQTQVVPGQKAVYTKSTGAVTIEDVSTENISSWIDNKLIFNDEELGVVFQDLAKHYGVEIKVSKKEINACRLTATFENQKLEDVLSTLESTLELKIIRTEDTVRVSGKGC